MKLLLIDDDKQMALTIQEEVKRLYAIDLAFTGEDGERKASTNDYDVIILDVMLPDVSGVEVCRRIRENEIDTPILMLTGQLEIDDKVLALDGGADDYLTKPFSFSELLARLRALTRRNYGIASSSKLSLGDLELDMARGEAKYAGLSISLRKKELQLLEYLMINRGMVLTRPMILEHVWESDSDLTTNTVDVHINSLRKKIDKKYGVAFLKTVHGLGYKIELPTQ